MNWKIIFSIVESLSALFRLSRSIFAATDLLSPRAFAKELDLRLEGHAPHRQRGLDRLERLLGHEEADPQRLPRRLAAWIGVTLASGFFGLR
jgi:hypothetical protein